jgi:RND family efflux transporter MFP subunit
MTNLDTSVHRRKSRPGFIGGKIIWAILILGAVGTTVLLSSWASIRKNRLAEADKSHSTFTVRRDDLVITVTESGSIKAQESTDIMCEVEGRLGRGVDIVSIVPEGTTIRPEDVNKMVLCQLNEAELQDTYNQEKITFGTAKAAYVEAQEAHLIQKKQNESDIAAAQLAVKFGMMDFQKYLGEATAGQLIEEVNRDPNATIDASSLLKNIEDPNSGSEASQKLRELSGTIALAEANLEKATDTLKWTKELFKKQYVAETELKKDELEQQRLIIEKEKGEIALRLFKLYEFPKQVEQLLSDYREARRQLERTLAQARSKLAQAQAKLDNAKATFELQQERVTKLEREINVCTILAPTPGIVVYGTSADWYRRRDDPIEVGDMVRKGQKIITIPNSDVMGVELRVHESEVDKVRPGQQATVTVEAFPDKKFQGEVLKVAPLADPQHGWLSAGVKVYSTEVSIKGSYDFIRPGMSAKVEIFVDHLKDVMIVPIQVVANRQGKKVCYVPAADGPKEREVQTGAFNETFVEITSGLQVGEQVLLNPPRLVESASDDKSKKPPKKPGGRKPAGGTKPTQQGTRPAPGSGQGRRNTKSSETDMSRRAGDGRAPKNR